MVFNYPINDWGQCSRTNTKQNIYETNFNRINTEKGRPKCIGKIGVGKEGNVKKGVFMDKENVIT